MKEKEKGGFSSRQGRRDYGQKDGGRHFTDRRNSVSGRTHFTRRKDFSGNAEKVDFSSDDYKNTERKSYGNGGSGNYGARREWHGNDSRDRRGGDSGRKPYGGDRGYGSDRNYGSDRSYSSDRSYGSDRSYSDEPRGEKRYGKQGNYRKQTRDYDKPKSYGKPKGYGRPDERKFEKHGEPGINAMIRRRPQIDAPAEEYDDTAQMPVKDVIRLNRFIANSGVCSRREADNLILAGTVTVNGEVVTELGTKVNIFTDEVRFNGERLKGEEKVYIVMNKPKGFVTTVSDPHAEKTVMDLLKGCKMRVFPVGRLDKNTTGVLMFTNDGEIAERLTHPSYDKKKIYQVIVDTPLKEEDREKILAGVELSDGVVKADELEYVDADDHKKLGIEIHSGKNRIVRRIFESLGYDVKALDRVYFAGLTKKGLKKGEWRFLTGSEVNILKMGAYV